MRKFVKINKKNNAKQSIADPTLFSKKKLWSVMLKKQLLLLWIFISFNAISQTYPVQVVPQLIPPYSLKLSDYQTSASEKLFVNILLTDINEQARQVRLKMYIEGQGLNITTSSIVAGAKPIYLDGGINLRLSNLDLTPYFLINNLVGINPQQYNTPLPNGRYNFCFEIYDYISGLRLSTKSCTSVYLIQNDPPFLNLPNRDDALTATNPQNIIFTWTPRHLNATNVQYQFTLKELWDTGVNPQAGFLVSPPLYSTTTRSTTLLYGPGEPQLLEGKTYAWQVRALVTDGISETSVFKNNGNSEIYWFNYTIDCDAPSFILSEAISSKTVKIMWQVSDHNRYQVQYRKKGYGDDDWFQVFAYNTQSTIHNLEAGTTYEFRVGGECSQPQGFSFSRIQEFKTPSEDEAAYYNCGIVPKIEIANQDPLQEIGANEVFIAGDFPIVVGKVSGSNGNFSGWGYITLPFLEQFKNVIDAANVVSDGKANIGKYTRIKVDFKGISINTDYQLIKGVVETTYDPNWGGILDVDAVKEEVLGADGDIKGYDASNIEIKNVIVKDGKVIIIGTDGKEHVIESKLPVVVTGKGNDKWQVNEDGTVEHLGEGAEGGTPNKKNTNGISSSGKVNEISSKDVTILFTPSGFYATDQLSSTISSSKFSKEYETIKKAEGGDYNVLYKAFGKTPHQEDFIEATATFSNGKTKDDIVFKTIKGIKVPVEKWEGNTATLKLNQHLGFAKDEILATVKPKDSTKKYDIAGKLNIWHLPELSINVTVVPLNNVVFDEATIKTTVNEIYNKAGINFNITVADPLSIPESAWDTENVNGKLDIGDSNTLANYTVEERAIFSYYQKQKGTKAEMYYIFLTDMPTTKEAIDGFMPLKRQYGFVFNQNKQERTIAHELGHGVFGLKHPFTEYNTKQGNTKLLMDYGTGTAFSHMDWQKLHEPGLQFYLFQSESAGEHVSSSLGKKFAINEKKYICDNGKCRKVSDNNKDGKYYYGFLTPSGDRIILPEDFIPIFYHGISNDKYNEIVSGCLIGFKEKNQDKKNAKRYWATIDKEVFSGYDEYQYQEIKIEGDDNSVVIGLPYGGKSQLFWKNYKFKKALSSYSGSKNILKITSETFKELAFFENGDVLTSKPIGGVDKLIGNSQLSVSEKELSLLRGDYNIDWAAVTKNLLENSNRNNVIVSHNEKPEVFLIIKIAEIYNRYPHIFTDFTKFFDNWDFGLPDRYDFTIGYWDEKNIMRSKSPEYQKWKNNISNEPSEELYDFYNQFLKELLVFITKKAKDNRDCLSSNFNSKTIEEVFECIRRASIKEIDALEVSKKIDAIIKIIQDDVLSDTEEIEIARLLKSIAKNPNAANMALFDLINEKITVKGHIIKRDSREPKIKDQVYPLWEVLAKVIQDEVVFWGENNKQGVFGSINKIYLNSDTFKEQLKEKIKELDNIQTTLTFDQLEKLHEHTGTYINDYQNIIRRAWSDIGAHPLFMNYESNDYYKSVDASIADHKIVLQQIIKRGLLPGDFQKTETLDPFKMVSFLNLSKSRLLKDYVLTDSKGKHIPQFLPALAVYYASEVDRLQTQEDIIVTTIDIATLIGSGGTSSLNSFGKFLYYADKVSSISSIVGTATREDHPEVSAYLNMLSAAAGATSAVSIFAGAKIKTKKITDIIDTDANVVERTKALAAYINDPKNASTIAKLNEKEINGTIELLVRDIKDFDGANIDTNTLKKALEKVTDGINKVSDDLFPILRKKLADLKVPHINDILIKVDDINKGLGNKKMSDILDRLLSYDNFENPKNVNDWLNTSIIDYGSKKGVLKKEAAYDLINEIEEGIHYLKSGKKVNISKKLNKDTNEIDVLLKEERIIVECKRVHSDSEKTMYQRIGKIYQKFIDEGKLTAEAKQQYPISIGQIRIDGDVPFKNLDKQQIVDQMKDYFSKMETSNLVYRYTRDLSILKEFHVINNKGRIIIKAEDWLHPLEKLIKKKNADILKKWIKESDLKQSYLEKLYGLDGAVLTKLSEDIENSASLRKIVNNPKGLSAWQLYRKSFPTQPLCL